MEKGGYQQNPTEWNAEDIKSDYHEVTGLIKHQETLLFQRLNYFLVSNAFLTAAFSAIVVGYFKEPKEPALLAFGFLISIVGAVIAWTFIVINYHNSLNIKMLYLMVEKIQLTMGKPDQYKEKPVYVKIVNDLLRERVNHPGIKGFFTYPIFGLKEGLPHPKPKDNDCDMPAPTTWMIPFGFFFFWVIIVIVYAIFTLYC